MNTTKFTREQIEKAMNELGHEYFTNGDYNINIIGIRNSIPGKSVTNIFDDWITISFKVNDIWHYYEYLATTDPGRKAMLEFKNPYGVAILAPGQYKGSHMIRRHKNLYEALGQKDNVKVFRDRNKDMVYDYHTPAFGVYGINIHRSNPNTESTYVENWSEGCQVFKRVGDFNKFMNMCRKAKELWGNSFTYTLIESKDIK